MTGKTNTKTVAKTTSTREASARSLYFKDLSKVVILSPEKEREIYMAYAASDFTDTRLRDQLIEGCLRLVVTRAKRFSRNNDSLLNELISAGNEGLLIALGKYDPTKGTRFPSYAIWWVDLYIRNALSARHPVKVPMWRQKKGIKLRRLRSEGKTTEEMAKECDLSVEKVFELEKHQARPADLDSLKAAGSVDYAKAVTDMGMFHDINVEQNTIDGSARDVLNEVLSELEEEEQNIIRSYYGIGRKAMNLPQIAATKDVTSERIRQIKNKLLEKMRTSLKRRSIESISDVI